MSENVSFVPLIELPFAKSIPSIKEPDGQFHENPEEWTEYFKKLMEYSYPNIPSPISEKVKMYKLFDLDWNVISKAIELHKGDLDLDDSCSFFGGYAIQIDNEIVLFPQCCGLLEKINDLKKMKQWRFKPFYLSECHPSPKFTKVRNNMVIECEDEFEPFIPETKSKIIIPYDKIVDALSVLEEKLKNYSKELDLHSAEYGVSSLSDILIWGRK